MNNIALIQERMIDDRWSKSWRYDKKYIWKTWIMERNRNSSSVTNGRNEKHIFGSSSKRKPRSFFGFVPQVFFPPLVSLFNLTPRVILHQYSPTSWTWRRFEVCVWSFFSNSSYKRNEEREKCEPVADSFAPVVAHHRMERKQRGSRVGAPSLPPLPFLPLPICPRASPTYFLR